MRPSDVVDALDGIRPGDHVAGIVTRGGELSLAARNVGIGLRRGESSAVIASPPYARELGAMLSTAGVDVEDAMRSRRLQFVDIADMAYKDGRFHLHTYCERAAELADELRRQGVRHVRGTGIVASYGLGIQESLRICSQMDAVFFSCTPLSGLCIWNGARIGGDLLVEVLRSHPKAWVNGELVSNPFYKRLHEVDARSTRVPVSSG